MNPVIAGEARHSAAEDGAILLARIALGAIFVQAGYGKLLGLGAFAASLESRGIPAASLLALIAAVVEFGGGILVVLGLKTRYAALLMLLFTIVATAMAHRYWEFADAARRTQESQFFKNVAIMGGFLLLSVTGSGRFGIDALLGRRRR